MYTAHEPWDTVQLNFLVCMDGNENFVRQICLCKLYSLVECSCELDVGYEGRERQLAWLWFCEL